jgi:hypothetical protein
MNKTLTPWFPPHVKPVRVGVYQVEDDRIEPKILENIRPIFSYWNGQNWSNMRGPKRERFWRGLAIDPEAK